MTNTSDNTLDQATDARQQWEASVAETKRKLAELDTPDAKAFSELPGVAEMVMHAVSMHPDAAFQDVVAPIMKDYAKLAQQFTAWNPPKTLVDQGG